MPEVVARYVLPEFAVETPVALVCQYHVSPAGGVPTRVIVTPGLEHCGELLVGFAGFAGVTQGAETFNV